MNPQDDEYAEELRAFARDLFKPDEDETDETEPAEPNRAPGHVPNEGQLIEPPPDDPMRAFARALFN